jgi:hypothetical protein
LVGSLIALVCFILVIVKMFQHQHTGLAIVCIVLFCCFVGHLIGFIFGWMKSGEWNIRNIMIAWTVGLVMEIAGVAISPPDYSQFQKQLEQQQNIHR